MSPITRRLTTTQLPSNVVSLKSRMGPPEGARVRKSVQRVTANWSGVGCRLLVVCVGLETRFHSDGQRGLQVDM